jgi:hypothetical protein
MVAQPVPFFIVFDTCTHARYYGDVHEVLAMPEGGIIRYEYKRSLFKPDAAAALEALCNNPLPLPVDALLMYGQKRNYRQGEPDPTEMLRWHDSDFIPTRSASVVAVARVHGAEPASDVLHFHLQMKGFVDPDTAAIAQMVQALEAGDALPFGERGRQHVWISLLPAALDPSRGALRSDSQQLWGKVVDKFVTLDTQFKNDIFWRVRDVCEASQTSRPGAPVPLQDRGTNERVHTSRWHRDYSLYETDRYEIFVETHSPDAHGNQVPGDATLAMTSSDDEEGLIKLSAQPLAIVPNETTSHRFFVDNNNVLDTRYSGIRLETQVPDHTSAYPAGSLCNLTFAIRKKRSRLLANLGFVLAGTTLGGYATAAPIDPIVKGLCLALAAFLIAFGGLFLTRQFRLVK